MKVYIAGPMTGIQEFNFPAFHRAAARLRALGHEVVNPAEIANDQASWELCMRRDLPELLGCEAVAVLADWWRSRGARLEVHVAAALGMAVIPVEQFAPSYKTRKHEDTKR